MPRLLLIFSQSDYLIQAVDVNSHSNWQTVDPDQLASSEANWSGSTLFAKAGYIWGQQDKGKYPKSLQCTMQQKGPLFWLPRPGSAHTYVLSDQCLHCWLTIAMDAEEHIRMSQEKGSADLPSYQSFRVHVWTLSKATSCFMAEVSPWHTAYMSQKYRFWWNCVDAQGCLNLCCPHML